MPRDRTLEDAIRDDFARATADPYDDLIDDEDTDVSDPSEDDDEDDIDELSF